MMKIGRELEDTMRRVATTFLLGTLFCVSPLLAQEIPAEYQQVLTSLDKQGDFKANVRDGCDDG